MTTLDEVEVALQEHMMKILYNSLKSKSGKFGQVANQCGEGGEEEEHVQQLRVAQGGAYWIRIAMMRARTEEHGIEKNRMQEEDTRQVGKPRAEGGKAGGKGKAPKGKGKGPNGGCHEVEVIVRPEIAQ